jgi:hypothetical protein
MVTAVGNYDFIFWHLKLVTEDQDNPLKDRYERFVLDIKSDLQTTNGNLKLNIQNKFPLIFDLRLDALRVLMSKNADLLGGFSKRIQPYFEKVKAVKNYAGLAGNLLTSFLLNKAVIESLNQKTDFLTETGKAKMPNISFDQLLAGIYFGTPNYEIASALIDWMKCSLFIEYITIATYTLYENRLLVAQDTINELANILAETNFAYAALATEFGVITYPDKVLNSPKSHAEGATYFKRMLDEKNVIHEHLKQGGRLSDLKGKFNFVDPLSLSDK